MKKLMMTFACLFSFSALATESVDKFKCGLELGKAIVQLSPTKVKDDVVLLADSIADYDAQIKEAVKEKDAELKELLFRSSNNTQQSIVLALSSIRSFSATHADTIEKACGLAGPE